MFACVLPAIAARYYNRGVIRKTCYIQIALDQVTAR